MSEEQFLRLERLIGRENIERLHRSKVTVCGCGAVGGFALESIARCGIGNITLVDADKVSVTNLNRQIIALHSTVGRRKTEVARERVLDINPECNVKALDLYLGPENYSQALDGADIVLDCIDSVSAKIGLIEYAVTHEIPIISSMGAALRRDISQIRAADLQDTYGCPLARVVRRGLKKKGITEGVRVIFSPEPVDFNFIPADEDPQAESMKDGGRARTVLGSMATITAVFGEYVAHEALNFLLKN